MKYLLCFFLLVCSFMFAQNSSDSTAAKLIEVSGQKEQLETNLGRIIKLFKNSQPDVPTEYWTKFEEKVSVSRLIDILIPIYKKYYSVEEMNDLISFYESPTGQKFIKTQPILLSEITELGKEYGAYIGNEIMKELQSEQKQK